MKLLARVLIITLYGFMAPIACAQTSVAPQAASPVVSRAELDQLLAPVALYPDTVLSHLLIAATYPLEVVHAHRWSEEHSQLGADAAREAVEDKDWDPSVKALVAFPELLSRLSDDLEWTEKLGEAFLADEAAVMDAIQGLRQHAYATGSLDKMQHLRVERVEKTIVIEPAVERVVYIPYYDTRVVYGSWWWSDHPPVYWRHPRDHVYVGGHYWGQRAHLGSSFFFASFHWPQRRVVHIHHHHHRPFYSARRIASFEGATPWRHDPVHRRGVAYRHKVVQQRFDHVQRPYYRRHSTRDRDDIRHDSDRWNRHRSVPENRVEQAPPRKAAVAREVRRSEGRPILQRQPDRLEAQRQPASLEGRESEAARVYRSRTERQAIEPRESVGSARETRTDSSRPRAIQTRESEGRDEYLRRQTAGQSGQWRRAHEAPKREQKADVNARMQRRDAVRQTSRPVVKREAGDGRSSARFNRGQREER